MVRAAFRSEPSQAGMRSVRYSDLASALVPEPTKRRVDRVLFYLRTLDDGETITAGDLARHMLRNRPPRGGYSTALCLKDLNRLLDRDLVRYRGHPKQWSAR